MYFSQFVSKPNAILIHLENIPIQIFEKKKKKKASLIVFIYLLKIDCGYSLEPPWWGNSNEYLQSMFWTEIY